MSGDGTRCVRAGLPEAVPGQPFLPGPVFAAPYHLDPVTGPAAGVDGYGRTDNPTWRALEYDVDRHPIVIPAGTPPGDYWLELGLYDPRNGARLLRDNVSTAEPEPDRFLVGPVHVRKPPSAPSLAALHIQQSRTQRWPNGLTLLGYTLERERLPADDFLRVALFWRNDAEALPALDMRLRLLDAEGLERVTQQGLGPPGIRDLQKGPTAQATVIPNVFIGPAPSGCPRERPAPGP